MTVKRLQAFAGAYLILILFGAVLAAIFFWGIVTIQGIPPIARTFNDRQGQARLEALKVALTTTAGLGAAAGLYLSYRRQKTEEQNSFRDQDRIFTERFTVAANLLAHDSAAVRLAGITSLARLADDSARDRETCLSTLCAYLRIPVEMKEVGKDSDSKLVDNQEYWVDSNEWDVRRTALQLVSDRLRATPMTKTWRGAVDLRGAVLIEANFSYCEFSDYADFSKSMFLRAANFEQCKFGGDMDFTGARFVDDVVFDGCQCETLRMGSCVFVGEVSFQDVRVRKKLVFDASEFAVRLGLDLELGIFASFLNARLPAGIRIDLSLTYRTVRPRINITTRRFNFTHSSLGGEVFLPAGLSCVCGTDFSEVTYFNAYDMFEKFASVYPPTFDNETRWPPGYDPRRWPGVPDHPALD